MKPLLWKEAHDLRGWVLAGLALAASFELLLQVRGFRASWEGGYLQLFMPLLCTVAAIGLGAGQIARERHRQTLDYLLVRPVARGVIIWAKFLAGIAALALLIAVLVGVGYLNPQTTGDTALRAIREQVGCRALALTLFPRYCLIYALALFASVLVDRSAKAVVIMMALAITATGLIAYFTLDAPFSGFVYFLPMFDTTGGLVLAAKSPAISLSTGLACGAAATLVATAAAALLNGSPERRLGNRGITLVAVGMAGAALLSAASAKLAETLPVGSIEVTVENEYSAAGLAAGNRLVGLAVDEAVRFFDFSQPSKPALIREVKIPLWTIGTEWEAGKAAMDGDTFFAVGGRKGVPGDETQLVMARPDGAVATVPLGPARSDVFYSTPVPVGGLVYLGRSDSQECGIHAFDCATRREVAVLAVDRYPRVQQGAPPVRLLRRGSYLYVASPDALTAIDISQPAQPVVTGRVELRPKAQFLFGFPRPLVWQDNQLFAIEIWPSDLASFDLTDPAHPVRRADFNWHAGLAVFGSGRDLYVPWRSGVLEARAGAGEIDSLRYLYGAGTARAIAFGGGYLYALTDADSRDRRILQAFRMK